MISAPSGRVISYSRTAPPPPPPTTAKRFQLAGIEPVHPLQNLLHPIFPAAKFVYLPGGGLVRGRLECLVHFPESLAALRSSTIPMVVGGRRSSSRSALSLFSTESLRSVNPARRALSTASGCMQGVLEHLCTKSRLRAAVQTVGRVVHPLQRFRCAAPPVFAVAPVVTPRRGSGRTSTEVAALSVPTFTRTV